MYLHSFLQYWLTTGWLTTFSKVLFFFLQGVDSAILTSQPFLLITKPTKKTEHTLLGSLEMCFFCFYYASSGAKTLMKQHPIPEINKSMTFKSPFQWKKQQTFKVRHLFSGCTEECTVSKHQLCRTLVPKLLVVLFISISISHCCTSLLHWCGSKWPKATGFIMDTRSGATTQHKASSHELPMICIAEVTFYPGCAIAVI